jgi:hypothetical protein
MKLNAVCFVVFGLALYPAAFIQAQSCNPKSLPKCNQYWWSQECSFPNMPLYNQNDYRLLDNWGGYANDPAQTALCTPTSVAMALTSIDRDRGCANPSGFMQQSVYYNSLYAGGEIGEINSAARVLGTFRYLGTVDQFDAPKPGVATLAQFLKTRATELKTIEGQQVAESIKIYNSPFRNEYPITVALIEQKIREGFRITLSTGYYFDLSEVVFGGPPILYREGGHSRAIKGFAKSYSWAPTQLILNNPLVSWSPERFNLVPARLPPLSSGKRAVWGHLVSYFNSSGQPIM